MAVSAAVGCCEIDGSTERDFEIGKKIVSVGNAMVFCAARPKPVTLCTGQPKAITSVVSRG